MKHTLLIGWECACAVRPCLPVLMYRCMIIITYMYVWDLGLELLMHC